MTVYHYSDVKGNRYSYYDMQEKDCSCGRNCGGSCSKNSSQDAPVGGSFSGDNTAFEAQEATEFSFLDQESSEIIWVKESCNIEVNTTDTQIGVSLQAALQFAIALVLNVSIADGAERDAVSEELMLHSQIAQRNRQKIYIYNTKDAKVTTHDTDLALNIQLLLQILITLMLLIDIL